MPGPPIEAIDEPSSESFWWSPADDASYSHSYICLGGDPNADDDEPCEPTPAEIEELRRSQEKIDQATKPAKGVEPRAIARLRLTARGPKSQAQLVAWRTHEDKLCLGSSEEDEDGGGSGGPFGPCYPYESCREICLDFSGSGSGTDTRYLIVGILSSQGDRLRMTLDDRRVVTYELAGPLVPGFRQYRVFMVDLGRDLYERLELLKKDEVIAEEKRSRAELRSMRCNERFLPPTMPSDEQDRSRLEACIRKARSE